MSMPLPEVLALALSCAPAVAPETLLSIVQVESRFRPLAIGVNGPHRRSLAPKTPADAAAQAASLIAQGRSVDLGLAQINSRNLKWLGLSVEAAFDPCRNLAAAARVLQAGYDPSSPGDAQAALVRALSRYNTGHMRRGVANGYVAKVARAAAEVVPALAGGALAPTGATQPLSAAPAAAPPPPAPPPPAWDVFGETGSDSFVLRVGAPAPLAKAGRP